MLVEVAGVAPWAKAQNVAGERHAFGVWEGGRLDGKLEHNGEREQHDQHCRGDVRVGALQVGVGANAEVAGEVQLLATVPGRGVVGGELEQLAQQQLDDADDDGQCGGLGGDAQLHRGAVWWGGGGGGGEGGGGEGARRGRSAAAGGGLARTVMLGAPHSLQLVTGERVR
ncbi:hypothetical protein FGB62_66g126 [Gracilaria domingensis]|nr:hypothetical protein FGB62_66g126 [Gracilaria domingensis]